jgi:hypothetical protein
MSGLAQGREPREEQHSPQKVSVRKTDWSGRMLGRYRALAELGSGGMGVVYEAEDTVLQRRVAIKTLPFLHEAQAADRLRLIAEARAAARISHPHVVTIHDVESSGDIDFLVMELLPRGSLGQQLAERGPLPWQLATRLVAQACAGLAAAHAAGIVHRDIKPSNLMLAGEDDAALTVKIADFGISRLAIPQGSASGPLVAAGTIHYMSPEQCEGEAEPRSDLYSLGATYYALLTGSPPFVAEHPLQVMFKHCSSPVPDPRASQPELSAGSTTIIRRAMAKAPAERYADARAMQHDLERLLTGDAPLPSPEAPPQAKPRPAPRKRLRMIRASRGTWIAALSVLLLAGLAGGAIWSQWPEATPEPAPWPRVQATANTPPPANLPGAVSLAWRPGFREVAGQIEQVSLSHDGRYLACALGTGGGIVMDVEGDERLRTIETHTDSAQDGSAQGGSAHVRSVAFAGDPQHVIAAVGNLVQSHCFETGRFERLQTLKGVATSVAVSRCGKHLAVGEDLGLGKHGLLWLHEVGPAPAPANLARTRSVEFPYLTGVTSVVFSPDSQQVAAASEYGSIGVYDVAQTAPLRILNMPEPQRRGCYGWCIAYSPDSALLASGGDRRVVMWNTSTWQERVLAAMHQGPITQLAFSADGKWLITAASDGLVRWDLSTGEATSRPLPLSSPAEVRALVFVGGDEWLLSGAADKRFLLWNWHTAFAVAAARDDVRREEVRRAEGLRR